MIDLDKTERESQNEPGPEKTEEMQPGKPETPLESPAPAQMEEEAAAPQWEEGAVPEEAGLPENEEPPASWERPAAYGEAQPVTEQELPGRPPQVSNPYIPWQGGARYGAYPGYSPAPSSAPVPPVPGPKRKMSTGLRVFLCVLAGVGGMLFMSLLAQAVLLGTGLAQPESSVSSRWSGNSSSGSSRPETPKLPGGGLDPNSGGIPLAAVPDGEEKLAKEVYKEVVDSVVGVVTDVMDDEGKKVSEKQGSGIIATQDGAIITNAHVVGNSKMFPVQVVLHNNSRYNAVVVGFDASTDLAVLKIDEQGLTPAQFASSANMEIGDRVVAIGNPGGLTFSSSMTDGIISALDRTLDSNQKYTYIQTNAAINPGNSGGALVNMYGQVIGISASKISNVSFEGMGFAIPMERAKLILDDLIRIGYVRGRGRLGITVVQAEPKELISRNITGGVIIVSIAAGSPLERVAKVGDVIVEAAGQPISTTESLHAVLGGFSAGDTIALTLADEQGQTRQTEVKLIPDEGETQKAVSQPE